VRYRCPLSAIRYRYSFFFFLILVSAFFNIAVIMAIFYTRCDRQLKLISRCSLAIDGTIPIGIFTWRRCPPGRWSAGRFRKWRQRGVEATRRQRRDRRRWGRSRWRWRRRSVRIRHGSHDDRYCVLPGSCSDPSNQLAIQFRVIYCREQNLLSNGFYMQYREVSFRLCLYSLSEDTRVISLSIIMRQYV